MLKKMVGAVALATALGAAPGLGSAAARPSYRPDPVVIAIVDITGLNVLHEEFAASETLTLPADMPAATSIRLPGGSTFEERLAAAQDGPLGKLKGERLYSIDSTRIAGIYFAAHGRHSIVESRSHGTGTSSSAVGSTVGTSPNALLVYVPATGRDAWEWLVNQDWIDIVSASYTAITEDGTCPEADAVRKIVRRGRLVFAAAGNQEPFWPAMSPTGLAEAYQVGGVDRNGRTYLPPGEDGTATDPIRFTDTTTRPYETGDRFIRDIADPDDDSRIVRAGGTSFAAPATAGRAAGLIELARRILRTPPGDDSEALASLGPGGKVPPRGPLADGELTNEELIDLLHHTAAPAEPASPFRYLVEGYGAHDAATTRIAAGVLSGSAVAPARPEEDQMNEWVEDSRRLLFPSERCN
ncbi:MAG TPA: S8/S53 family peptidase [Actinomycetota bacterium]|nr:S8/S53 family peptidase [Actinomycetota bacterium]